MSERRDEADAETRAGTVNERAGAAGRRAIAARDDDDDKAAVAGATRTPADERREIIVWIEEAKGSAGEEKSVGIEKKLCFFFLPFAVPRLVSLKNDDDRTRYIARVARKIDWLA